MGVNEVNGREMYEGEIENGGIGVEGLLFSEFAVGSVGRSLCGKN